MGQTADRQDALLEALKRAGERDDLREWVPPAALVAMHSLAASALSAMGRGDIQTVEASLGALMELLKHLGGTRVNG